MSFDPTDDLGELLNRLDKVRTEEFIKAAGCSDVEEQRGFGKRLRELRLELEMKSKDAAAALQLSRSYYCQLETGDRAPSLRVLLLIKRRMRADLGYLITGEYE